MLFAAPGRVAARLSGVSSEAVGKHEHQNTAQTEKKEAYLCKPARGGIGHGIGIRKAAPHKAYQDQAKKRDACLVSAPLWFVAHWIVLSGCLALVYDEAERFPSPISPQRLNIACIILLLSLCNTFANGAGSRSTTRLPAKNEVQ